jgi:small multidrug resistance pump
MTSVVLMPGRGSWSYFTWTTTAVEKRPAMLDVIEPSQLRRQVLESCTLWMYSSPVAKWAFYFLSVTLRTIPIGVTYAIWSGVGVALVSVVGWIVYRQRLDVATMIGMGLIVSGVLTIQLFGKSAPT